MSCDGGLLIKIVNPILLEILKSYKSKKAFDDATNEMIEVKEKGLYYDFYYEYFDCAYILECPSKLEDIAGYIFELIETYNEDFNPNWEKYERALLMELTNRKEEIVNGYQFVEWQLINPDFDGNDEKVFHYVREGFSFKKASSKKSNPKKSVKHRLEDIFPQLDANASDRGLTIKDNAILDIDLKKHYDFLGMADSIYLPSDIKKFDEDFNTFNCPARKFENFVITTAIKELLPCYMLCRGFENFYIIDEVTEEIIFHTNKFIADEEDYNGSLYIWTDFCEYYDEDFEGAISDELYIS